MLYPMLIGSDKTQLAYELTTIRLEYEIIHSQELADKALSNDTNGRDSCTSTSLSSRQSLSVDKGSDTKINESINVPRRSMTGLLFYKPYVAGAEDSEKTFNPDITEVKAVVDRILNRVYSQGMGTRNIWEEVLRRFGKENSTMNATDFYAGYRFSLSSISGV